MTFLDHKKHKEFTEVFLSKKYEDFKIFQSINGCEHLLSDELLDFVFPVIYTHNSNKETICRTVIKITECDIDKSNISFEVDKNNINNKMHNQILFFKVDENLNILEKHRHQLTIKKII
jgi:hypothetical protein